MPLGTLDRTPPPFFKQGPSALTRLAFFATLAVFLMVADTRFKLTGPLRSAAALALQPLERSLLAPFEGYTTLSDYFGGIHRAVEGRNQAEHKLAAQAERTMRVEQLERENARLRELLTLRARLQVKSRTAEVLYDSADPYTRKVVIDQGSTQGVALGSPVVDDTGVIGQVTRLYPLTAEVTLVTDKDAAIPVLNTRTQQRGAAFGHPNDGGMELRYMAGNADVQAGDMLQTSGMDGVYPTGLPVAKVLRVDRRADSAFAKIVLAPIARPDSARQVLVLEPLALQLPERPKPVATASDDAASGATTGRPRRPARKGARP
ncbi:rod shape-determining protein MreC [Aquabacterium sp.]|uniref:rod shape-determining protein MreC n=1 Tax=Aquabacterium sp. TaxID=1872578 RepID=UPI0035AF1C8A